MASSWHRTNLEFFLEASSWLLSCNRIELEKDMKQFWHLSPLALLLLPQSPLMASAIEDNSFLLEEAFNQEAGVVQIVQTIQQDKSKDLYYSLSVEAPAPNQSHQLSFTLPYSRVNADSNDTEGLGDLALNYRYQALNSETVLVAPRFSILLPTGDDEKGFGTGVVGLQTNWAITAKISDSWVLHSNVGATYLPGSKQGLAEATDLFGQNAGLSLVWLYSENFNFLTEFVTSATEVSNGSEAVVENSATLNPGVRYAVNFDNSQLVLGASLPTPVLYSKGPASYFGYVSYEPKLW
jgi:hypothetical protein